MTLYVAAGIIYSPPPKTLVPTKIANVPFCSPHSIEIAYCCEVPVPKNFAQ